MVKTFFGWVAVSALFFLLAGCGEMVSPGVEVFTDPPGATVTIGHDVVGNTPVLITRALLKNHHLDTYTLVISKKGYRTKKVGLSHLDGMLRIQLQKN